MAILLAQRGGLSEPRFEPGEPTPRSRYDVGFFSWIAADCQFWSFTEDVHFLRELQLSFDMETLMSTLGGGFNYSCLCEPKLVIYEPRVTGCAKLLADLCTDSVPDDRLFGESVTVALLASVVGTVSGETGGRPSCQLAPWQIRLAKEYLEDNFSRGVSLAELASLTGLSRSWFARGFRGATGVSSYSWALGSGSRERKNFSLKATSRLLPLQYRLVLQIKVTSLRYSVVLQELPLANGSRSGERRSVPPDDLQRAAILLPAFLWVPMFSMSPFPLRLARSVAPCIAFYANS